MQLRRLTVTSLIAALFVLGAWRPAAADPAEGQDSQGHANQRGRSDTSQTRSSADRSQSHSRFREDSQSRNQLNAWRFIEDFDEDGNGALDRDELPRRMRSQFSRLDRNGDNRLTAEELRQHGQRAARNAAMPLEVVYIWVTDADQGHLSLNELQRAYDTLQQIDDNEDGELSRDELRQRRQQLFARWARTVTSRLDQDGDGQISQDEAQQTFLAGRFDRVDQNGDGEINRQELTQCIASGTHRGTEQEMRTGRRDDSHRQPSRQSSRDSDQRTGGSL